MIVEAFNRRKIAVTDEGRTLATINYPGWMASTGEITIGTRKLSVKRTNFWGNRFAIYRNGTREIGKIRLCRKSTLQIIDPLNGDELRSYHIERKGAFSWRYEVRDAQNNLLATFKAKWNWSRFANDLLLEYRDEALSTELLAELLTYTAFIAHHQYRQAAAAG